MWFLSKISKLLISILLLGLISACASSKANLPETATFSSQTPTATSIPTEVQPTLTLTPTLALPVVNLTPAPVMDSAITNQNATKIQEIARYYGDIDYVVKHTEDGHLLFILDHMGVTIYEYPSMEKTGFVALPNQTLDFQTSSRGDWWLIQDQPTVFLVDARDSFTNPQIYDLKDHLETPYRMNLSPDGSMISAVNSSTSGFRTEIISTEDFSHIFTISGDHPRSGPGVFSTDGSLFAQASSQAGSGGSVAIYNLSDFTRVTNIRLDYPFVISSIAFSHDNSYLAVGQVEAITVYSLINDGKAEAKISDLCKSWEERQVGFALSSANIFFESTVCTGANWWNQWGVANKWQLSDDSVALIDGEYFPLSKSALDDDANATYIPYPEKIEVNFKPYDIRDGSRDFLIFADNQTAFFETTKVEGQVYYGGYRCNLSLEKGRINCEAYNPEEIDGKRIEPDPSVITRDGNVYELIREDSSVNIVSSTNTVVYSIPLDPRHPSLYVLYFDPQEGLIIYQKGLEGFVLENMENGEVLRDLESVLEFTYSADGRYAGICSGGARATSWNYENYHEVLILDLSSNSIVRQVSFDCQNTSMAFSPDGSNLAVYSYFIKDPSKIVGYGQDFFNGAMGTRVMLLNTSEPYEREYVETDLTFGRYFPRMDFAVAYAFDASLLAVSCGKHEICFIDTTTNEIFHRIDAQSRISHLAFSPDGKFLAALTRWGTLSLYAIKE